MNISPFSNVSFKGTITVKTRKSKDEPAVVQTYKTTKKQDGELLKAAADVLRQTGYAENIYGEDTLRFHNKVEEIIGKKIEQSNLGNEKIFLIGGDIDNLFRSQKYDTSYNKIFYNDKYIETAKSSIRVDLMEPEERLNASMETLSKIQERMETLFHSSKKDSSFNIDSSKIPKEKCEKIEEILNQTLYYLDGNIGGTDFSHKAPQLYNSYHAYETLMENLMPVLGMKYEDKPFDEFKYPMLESNDYGKVRRAVYYLQQVLPTLQDKD